MTEMIERVARAIYEKRNGAGCRPWTRQNAAYQAPYLDDARAAIEAMRIPTEAMRKAYNDEDIVGYSPDPCNHDLVWKTGIDAALNENGEC